jgi:hypothetical protein
VPEQALVPAPEQVLGPEWARVPERALAPEWVLAPVQVPERAPV